MYIYDLFIYMYIYYVYIYIYHYKICWKAALLCQPFDSRRVGPSTTSPRRFPPERRRRSRCPGLAQLGAAARGRRGGTAEAREVPGEGRCHMEVAKNSSGKVETIGKP